MGTAITGGDGPLSVAMTSLQNLGIKIAGAHPLQTNGVANLSNEVLFWVRATANQTAQITVLGCNTGNAATTPGAGVNEMGIFSLASPAASSATLAAKTGDMTSAFETSGGGWTEGTLASPYALQEDEDYILGVLTSFTGTQPSLTRYNLGANINPFQGLYLCGYIGSQATMPTTLSLSGSSVSGSPYSLYGR